MSTIPWNKLTKNQQNQIRFITVSLKEFCYGFDRLQDVIAYATPGSAIIRFYGNCLYQYCGNYYMVGGALKLRNVLEDLGCDDLLEPLEEILNYRLGETTFGNILKIFRDKFLTQGLQK